LPFVEFAEPDFDKGQYFFDPVYLLDFRCIQKKVKKIEIGDLAFYMLLANRYRQPRRKLHN
jgi:hypothetical protein